MVRMQPLRTVRPSLRGGVAAAAGLLVLGAAASAGAQEDRSGFYVGLELGVAIPSGVDSTVRGVNHPTRCDRLLYPPSISPPDDAACRDNTPAVLVANEFDPGAGFANGFTFGYAAGGPRFEVEYVNRYQGDDVQPLGGTESGGPRRQRTPNGPTPWRNGSATIMRTRSSPTPTTTSRTIRAGRRTSGRGSAGPSPS